MTRQRMPVVPYGRRKGLSGADAGIRQVAPTFGKLLHLTSSSKSAERLVVESDAERLVGHLLTLDPRVRRFVPQPFTVDLIEGRLLWSPDEVAAARKRHKGREGRKFYTPDFAVDWVDRPQGVLEVKLEGFDGDDEYQAALHKASALLHTAGHTFTKVVVPAGQRSALRFNVPLLRKAQTRLDLWPSAGLVRRLEGLLEDGPRALVDVCRHLELSPCLVPHLMVAGAVGAKLAAQTISGEMLLHAAFGDQSHLFLLEELVV